MPRPRTKPKRREDDRWLLDGYGDDFLRSSMLVAIRKVDKGAIANERMKVCMSRQISRGGCSGSAATARASGRGTRGRR